MQVSCYFLLFFFFGYKDSHLIKARRRHIKCDQAKPMCIQCKRSNKSCIGYLYGGLEPETSAKDIINANRKVLSLPVDMDPHPEATKAIEATEFCLYFPLAQLLSIRFSYSNV